MNYCVYILKSLKDNKHYIGCTSDFTRRLEEHNSGNVASTRSRRPLELIYKESFSDKRSAMKRERFLKSGKGREVVKRLNVAASAKITGGLMRE